MVRAVLFDCDGILLDSMNSWHSLEVHLASRANITLTANQMDMLNKNTLRQTVQYFYTEYRIEIVLKRFMTMRIAIYSSNIRTISLSEKAFSQ